LTLDGFPVLSISASTSTVPKIPFAFASVGKVGRTIFSTVSVGGVQMIRGEGRPCCPMAIWGSSKNRTIHLCRKSIFNSDSGGSRSVPVLSALLFVALSVMALQRQLGERRAA
jgi:hypothetical protein